MLQRGNVPRADVAPSRLTLLVAAGSLLANTAAGCNAGQTLYIGKQSPGVPATCDAVPSTPNASLGLDPFFAKYLDAAGIPILASAAVDDRAMVSACSAVVHALPVRRDIVAAMVQRKLRVAVIGRNEVTTDIPEYRDLYQVWPDSDWNGMRGVGATLARPVTSVGEENLLCIEPDPYHGESIVLQAFSHGIRTLGIESLDDTFTTRLNDAFNQAKSAGLWANTFAGTEARFYFACGVEDWFDANAQASPADGVHNEINTRSELQAYDPTLAGLIGDYLSAEVWSPSCPL